ncbi:MAG: diaminopimelate epimerase [Phaeodactylibacter sp.]|nr:diaminopimelate epimerase [Phaeodactylibacter sp.]MCB9049233.1 diaminopimelate epimerase [Lewinellaceae bacterium]
MQKLPFYKYQGTGNDFVMVDQRESIYLRRTDTNTIARLCHRRFGIGADGLILLQQHPDCDFEMVYFNADGGEGSMCGNGGRCIVAFARQLGIIEENCQFIAVDGPHAARIRPDGWVELQMSDVENVEQGAGSCFMNTGSPHYVEFVDDLGQINIIQRGREVRYSKRFKQEGTNVNFVEPFEGGISVATYERGVEDETLSCGTGVTASAIAHYLRKPSMGLGPQTVPVRVKGGRLEVRFTPQPGRFTNIWLCGPALLVYEGVVTL